jgi:TolB protein
VTLSVREQALNKRLRLAAPLSLLVALLVVAAPLRAQLTVEISGTGGNQIPIAVLPFPGESAVQPALTDVIDADLARSGRFRTLYTGPQNLNESSPIDFASWRARNADALVAGGVYAVGPGRYEARFRLYDVPKQAQLGGLALNFTAAQSRATGHRIADYIYEKLTGERGVFSTRIAYIVKQGSRYSLQIADADGANAQTALASPEPIISPAWSPDGARLAYVSFENKRPVVYVHSLATGQRQAVANFPGSNSAPAWSPDGSRLAVVLSREGGSQIFLINADGSGVRRVTSSAAIDTEPTFSPDGQTLYFTSDRGGSPQVYRVGVSGGSPQRVTFDGGYNVSPHLSPDGKLLAYVTRQGSAYRVAVLDLASGQTQIVSDGPRDESPSFAPNGRMIVYASEVGGRGILQATSSDGRIRQRLSVPAADVREPAWGPFLNQ